MTNEQKVRILKKKTDLIDFLSFFSQAPVWLQRVLSPEPRSWEGAEVG